MKPNVLVLTGYGINCDEETKFAFEKAGAKANIVHINDLIRNPEKLKDIQIFAFPGGFSYGDDTGSGYALANKIKNHLWDEIHSFIKKDKLAIGICNGFQVMVNLGILPASEGYGKREVALMHNNSAKYLVRWVDLEFEGKSPWVNDIKRISVPIAHGEGKFYAKKSILDEMKDKGMIAAKYVKGNVCKSQNLEANPNGSLEDIAAITDATGRLIGMMPHPERAIDFMHLPDWTLIKENYQRKEKKLPENGPGLKIFQNGVNYFK